MKGKFCCFLSLVVWLVGVENRVLIMGLSDRAFADYIFGSVILHFFCVNFIN